VDFVNIILLIDGITISDCAITIIELSTKVVNGESHIFSHVGNSFKNKVLRGCRVNHENEIDCSLPRRHPTTEVTIKGNDV
jgi:hypothetical protein